MWVYVSSFCSLPYTNSVLGSGCLTGIGTLRLTYLPHDQISDCRLGCALVPLEQRGHLQNVCRAKVGGEDDDGVLERYDPTLQCDTGRNAQGCSHGGERRRLTRYSGQPSAQPSSQKGDTAAPPPPQDVPPAHLRVRDPAVVQDLQQHVENVRMRLLHLVEQNDRVRPPPNSLGQLAALLVPDVSCSEGSTTRDNAHFSHRRLRAPRGRSTRTHHCNPNKRPCRCQYRSGRQAHIRLHRSPQQYRLDLASTGVPSGQITLYVRLFPSFEPCPATPLPPRTRRRADESGHAVLLHVLGHVDPHHGVLGVEQELGQGLGQLRLTHT